MVSKKIERTIERLQKRYQSAFTIELKDNWLVFSELHPMYKSHPATNGAAAYLSYGVQENPHAVFNGYFNKSARIARLRDDEGTIVLAARMDPAQGLDYVQNRQGEQNIIHLPQERLQQIRTWFSSAEQRMMRKIPELEAILDRL